MQALIEFADGGRFNCAALQVFGSRVDERKMRASAGFQAALADQVVALLHGQVEIAGDEQTVAATNRHELPFCGLAYPALDRAIVEYRREIQAQRHLAFHALDDAQQLPVRCAPPTCTHGEEVEQARTALVGVKRGFQHQGVRQITARTLVGADRRNLAMAALLPAEQTGETAA